MAGYFHGNSEIQGGGDGLQTLVLMNPGGYVGFSDAHHHTPATNFGFLNSLASANGITMSHAPPSQFVGVGSLPPASSSPHHDITALHEFIRCNYNSVYGQSVDLAAAREVARAQQGLSLSLSSQHGNFRAVEGEPGLVAADISPDDQVRVSGGSSSSASGISNGVQTRLLSSKYLRAAQELLDDVVNVGREVKNGGESAQGAKSSAGDSPAVAQKELTTAERQEIQMKKAKLVNMLDEVEQRYRQYYNQMHMVISWFEQAAGNGSAKTYTSLALQTISKQFRCLKDAILGQIRAASKSLGEDGVGVMKIETSSRLKFIDNQLRQQRALQQLGMIQQNAWRPQRGLPERSVSVLRAWLFEHFLHPYPKDCDKIMLAKQTGLTRGQVSNWFINARVRLWKPMVEEMYLEEINNNNKDEGDQDSQSLQENQERDATPNQGNNPPTEANLIGPSSRIESHSQGSPKKPRGSEMSHALTSIPPSITMKFEDQRHSREGFAPMEGSTNFMEAFGSYPMDQFQSPYSGNAVSLTLGLQHPENHHTFLPNQMGRGVVMEEANDFSGMTTPTSAHQTTMFDNFNIPNRKRFPPQLLPDFVT